MLSKTRYQKILKHLKVNLPVDQICLLEGVTPEMVTEAQIRMEEEAKTALKVRSALAEAAGIPEEQLKVAPTGRRGRWITEVSHDTVPAADGMHREELSDLEVRILKLCKKKGLPAHQISGRVQMAKRDVIDVLEGLVSEGLMYRIGIEEILYETVEDF